MEVLIIRHAQSYHNIGLTKNLDSKLTDEGHDQINFVSDWLKNNFDFNGYKGIVSPFFRTLTTAQKIHDVTGLDFKVSVGPREYLIDSNQHGMTGEFLPVANHNQNFTDFDWGNFKKITHFFCNSESTFLLKERVNSFIDNLEDGKYCIVSHSSVCTAMHNHLNPNKNFDLSEGVENASLTYLKNGNTIWYSKVVY